jgi:hypothetical protein
MYRGLLVALVVLALLRPGAFAESTRSKMTHIIVELSGTDIRSDSFVARPKTYWRASAESPS